MAHLIELDSDEVSGKAVLPDGPRSQPSPDESSPAAWSCFRAALVDYLWYAATLQISNVHDSALNILSVDRIAHQQPVPVGQTTRILVAVDLQSTSHSLRSRIVQQRVDLVEFGAVVGDSDHQMHAIH